MKYGRIAGNSSINTGIYRCFESLSESTANAFVRKFAEQPHDQNQVLHTYRELILGAHLASNGLTVESERPIRGRTPDWSILDNTTLACVVELMNFHVDLRTEEEIKTHFTAGTMWVGWKKPHSDRIYSKLQDKCLTYKNLAESDNIPYVIAVYSDFLADLGPDELQECLDNSESGLFGQYPHVSGALFFDDNGARYRFVYMPNQLADRPYVLPEGVFDLS